MRLAMMQNGCEEWQVSRDFDYDTISDIVLHIRYTARPGVEPTKVKAAVGDLFQEASQANLALLFSLRHNCPTEWSAFVNGTGDFTATIRRDYFPYFTQREADHGHWIRFVWPG
jgi:hypothetical protein